MLPEGKNIPLCAKTDNLCNLHLRAYIKYINESIENFTSDSMTFS